MRRTCPNSTFSMVWPVRRIFAMGLLAALISVGCQDQSPSTPTGQKDAKNPTTATAPSATKTAEPDTASEAPHKPDTPADVAALKADGAVFKKDEAGSIVSVDLSHGNASDATLSHLKGLPALTDLNLSGPSFTPDGLGKLNELTGLTRLGLEATNTNNAVLAALAKLPNLVVLNLFKTDVRDDGLKQLVAIKTLKDLDLRRTLTSDAGTANLKGLDSLKALKLQDTRVTEACLDSVLSLPALERLLAYLAEVELEPFARAGRRARPPPATVIGAADRAAPGGAAPYAAAPAR